MNQATALGGVFALGTVVGGLSTEFVHAQAPQYETKQVLQTDLNNLPGQEIMVFESTWQPGFRLPLHMHPNGHEITYVISGEQTFEIEGIGTKIVKAGEARQISSEMYADGIRRLRGKCTPTWHFSMAL